MSRGITFFHSRDIDCLIRISNEIVDLDDTVKQGAGPHGMVD